MASNVEAVTNETIEKGGILAHLYFDMYGGSKEGVENLLVDLADRLTKEKDVVYALASIERAMEMEDKKYSAAAEIKILTKNFNTMVRLCTFYGPMAIEIRKPHEIVLPIERAQNILMSSAQFSLEFTTQMLYKMMTPEERKALDKKIQRRAEMGKELMDKQKSEKSKEASD